MRLHRLLPSLLILCIAATVRADVSADAAAARIAPYVDEHTFAIVRIDFADSDAAILAAAALEPAGVDPASSQEMAELAQPWIAEFRKAGGRDLYVVFSLRDVPENPPFVVAPLEPRADDEKLAEALKQITSPQGRWVFAACRRHDRNLVAGTTAVLDRIGKSPAAPRPALAEAFAATANSGLQVLLVPSDLQRRVIREMLSAEPLAGGPSSGQVLADGIRWAAAGLHTGARSGWRVVIQSDNAAAAQRLSGWISASVRQVAKDVSLPEKLDPDQLASLLTPRPSADRLLLELDAGKSASGLASLLRPFVGSLRAAGREAQTKNNLKQIGLAMHVYHDQQMHFPPAASRDAQGKPLLSWRVHILQFIDNDLYRQFHLDEPWDSPHNRALIERMPSVYQTGKWRFDRHGRTTYLVPTGPQTVFEGNHGTSIRDITDGTSNTIMAFEAADERAVIWTKPADWEFDPEHPSQGLVNASEKGFWAVLCDGGVRFLDAATSPEALRALFTRNGGEPVP